MTPMYKFFLYIILVENKFSEETVNKSYIRCQSDLYFAECMIYFFYFSKNYEIYALTSDCSIPKNICSKGFFDQLLISARLCILCVFSLKESGEDREGILFGFQSLCAIKLLYEKVKLSPLSSSF